MQDNKHVWKALEKRKKIVKKKLHSEIKRKLTVYLLKQAITDNATAIPIFLWNI